MRSATLRQRFEARVRKEGDCWEWQGALRNGYGIINRGDKVPEYAHRLAYEYWVGPIPQGLVVRHHCDNRRCCRPDHLAAGTMSENSRDMVARGRQRGGKNHCHGEAA